MSTYTPPTELHAIGVEALHLYEAGGGVLSDKDCALVRSKLEALFGDFTALYDAVHSLCALMLHAQNQGRAEAAARLTELIRHTKPYFQARNQTIKESIGDQALVATRKLTQLTGSPRAARTAPVIGAARPAGAVPLAALRPVPTGPVPR